MTHHAPSIRSIAPHFLANELNAAYASELDTLVESSRAAFWIHGHTHHNVHYKIGGTTIISNQRGYPDEPASGFEPELVLSLEK